MFSLKSVATLALALNLVQAVPSWRRTDIPSRSEWKSKNLESYYRFKTRYRNLGCDDIKGTDFYNQCCLPLPSGTTPAEECTPSSCSAPSSAAAPTPTAYDDGGHDDGDDHEPPCDDETTSIAPTDGGDDGGYDDGDDDGGYDGDESDLPYCDEVGSDYEPITPSTSYTLSTSYSAPAPEPTTTTEPEPTTTPEPEPTTPAPEPTTTTQEPPAPTTTAPADNNTGNSDVQTGGFATFYYQNGNAGACGDYSGDYDLIGAIDQARYGYDFGVKSSECGRRVRITNTNNGKTVDITIKDVCPTCANGNSIDLSVGAFQAIADPSEGMVPISWYYLS